MGFFFRKYLKAAGVNAVSAYNRSTEGTEAGRLDDMFNSIRPGPADLYAYNAYKEEIAKTGSPAAADILMITIIQNHHKVLGAQLTASEARDLDRVLQELSPTLHTRT